MKPVRADWRDNEGAFLVTDDGGYVAELRLDRWYPDGDRRPRRAWIVSWVDHSADSTMMLRALVEIPARPADDERRREELLGAALTSMSFGPPHPPMVRASRLSETPDYRNRFRQVELLIDAWDRANGTLGRVLRDHDAYPTQRYIALSDVLARTYAVDRTLEKMWERLPVDLRDDASHWTDERAVRAIAHNTTSKERFSQTYEPSTDISFEAYFARLADSKPYPHWTGPLLSGAIQEGFFRGLRWIRGQMTYFGVIDPIELWQYEAGVEPRWKWKDAAAITTALSSNARERALYERLLAGSDVVGFFSHLLTIFWDAKWMLRKLSRRAELRRPGLATRE